MREIEEGNVVCLKSDKNGSVVFTVGGIHNDTYGMTATCYFIQDNSIPSSVDIPLIALTRI